jgi:centrosomal CEP192-like protein/beta-propeller repeat-containing protein
VTIHTLQSRFLVFFLVAAFSVTAFSTSAREAHPTSAPLTFEVNRGQVNSEVRYLARSSQGTIYLTDDDVVLLAGAGQTAKPLRVHFVGGAPSAPPQGESATGGYANYYLTGDPHKWLWHLPLYGAVRYSALFPGIDAVFHGNQQNVEYDFHIAPRTSPDEIAFAFDVADSVRVTADDGLEVSLGATKWLLAAPHAYQWFGKKRVPVEIRYVLSADHVARFRLGAFDANVPLVIDPVVQYATSIMANGDVSVTGLQVDSSGNLIIAGTTRAMDYPVVNGQAPAAAGGNQQVYITKLNSAGTAIIYSTYMAASQGGSNIGALAIDSQGNAYVTGITAAADFPVTSSNLGTCSQFCNAGFVAKFNSTGTLQYSTLLASGQVLPYSIAVDAQGRALVVGGAFDDTLITVNAFQSQYGGGLCTSCGSPFFAELNPTGTDFVFSSYFGGAGGGAGPSLAKAAAFDASGNILIAGLATADPPLVSPWQYGDGDLFLAEFGSDGKTLLFSTRFGASGDIQPVFDTLQAMASGPDGVVYLVGRAQTPDFPFSINAPALPQTPLGSFATGFYVLAVNPSFTGLQYSTFLGGLDPFSVAIDAANHLHIVGLDATSPFPLANAVVADISQGGYALELDPSSTPVVLTRFGGHLTQQIPSAVAVDPDLNVYLAGTISSGGFLTSPDPVMIGPSLTQNPDTSGSFFAKISPASAPQIVLNNLAPFLTLRNAGTAPLHIGSITFGGGLGKQWGTCGTTLPGGTSCMLTVTDANGNLAAGSVTINSDASPASQTFTVTLPSGVITGAPVKDFLIFQDVPFNFPLQLEGTPSAPIALTVLNAGTVNSVINSVTANGNATQTNNCGTVAPGGSCSIMVSVTPSSNNYAGELTISSDSGQSQQSYTFYSQFSAQPLQLSTNGISFATQQINGVAIPRVINFTNTSNSALSAPTFSLQGDPAFTILGNTCTAPIPAHGSCAVAVQMNSSVAGTYNGNLVVSASGGGGTVTLFGMTQNNTLLLPSPAGLNFGPTAVGGNQFLPLVVTNAGSSPYLLTGIGLSPAEFSETDNCQGQIAVNAKCTVTVKFSPQQLGLRRGAATIGVSISSVTQVVTVTGSGVVPLQVSSASLDFGSSVPVGSTSQPQTVNLQNQLSSAQGYALNTSAGFAVNNTCANPLPGGTTCAVSVTFQPTSTGAQQGTLTVSYPGTSLTSVVNLSGTSVQSFSLQASPEGSLSATVQSGSTAVYGLEATAANGFNGTVQLSCSGAPTVSRCSLQPTSLALSSGAASTFMVTVSTAQTAAAHRTSMVPSIFAVVLLLPIFVVNRKRGAAYALMACLLLVSALTGCGSAGSSSGGGSPMQNMTAPGTYTIVVTGTSGTATSSAKLTLIVQ